MIFYSSAFRMDEAAKGRIRIINGSATIACQTAFVGKPKLPLMDILFWHHSDSDKDNDIILKDPKVFERWLAA